MYRKCKSIFLNEHYTDSVEINYSFVLNGYQEYLPEAKELYAKYRLEIERIMHYFGCCQESELFVGVFLSSSHNDEAKDFYKLSCMMIKKLWKHMREQFAKRLRHEKLTKRTEKDIEHKIASAWYYACYLSQEENKKLRILSFPWILEDVLYKFDIKNNDLLSHSIIDKFCTCRDDLQLISRFIQKIELKEELEQITNLNLIICGSFGLFLFEDTNEVQLFVYNKNSSKSLITEDTKDILDESFYNVSLNDNIIACNDSEDLSFTINDSTSSVKRYLYLRKSIFNNPQLLPVFFSIIHFARLDNIFLTLNLEKLKLDNYLEFCLDYFIEQNYVTGINDSEIEQEFQDLGKKSNHKMFDSFDDWSQVHDFIDDMEHHTDETKIQIGKMILNFYKEKSFQENKFKFVSKFDENKQVELDDKSNDSMKNHFFNVFNLLSKTCNISEVWNKLNKQDEPIFKKKFYMSKKKALRQIYSLKMQVYICSQTIMASLTQLNLNCIAANEDPYT